MHSETMTSCFKVVWNSYDSKNTEHVVVTVHKTSNSNTMRSVFLNKQLYYFIVEYVFTRLLFRNESDFATNFLSFHIFLGEINQDRSYSTLSSFWLANGHIGVHSVIRKIIGGITIRKADFFWKW